MKSAEDHWTYGGPVLVEHYQCLSEAELFRSYRLWIACASLFLGGMLYLCFRPPVLLMFRWVVAAGLWQPLFELRSICAPLRHELPGWVIYSLPDGLWLLSLLAALDFVWEGRRGANLLLFAISASAISAEFAQRVWPRLGTFDWNDVFAISAASAYSVAALLRRS